jgi:hypothetical protein
VNERADDRVASRDPAPEGLGAGGVAGDDRDALVELAALRLADDAVTSWPAASACVTTSRPTLPLAPRTASLRVASSWVGEGFIWVSFVVSRESMQQPAANRVPTAGSRVTARSVALLHAHARACETRSRRQ